MFAIITSRGQYEDWRQTIHFLVEIEEDAKRFVDRVNQAIELVQSFESNDCRKFLTQYNLDHVRPTCVSPKLKEPPFPEQLRLLSKSERKNTALYAAYKEDLAKYKAERAVKNERFKIECAGRAAFDADLESALREFRHRMCVQVAELIGKHFVELICDIDRLYNRPDNEALYERLLLSNECKYIKLEVKDIE